MSADAPPRPRLDPSAQGDLFDPASVRWVLHLSDLRGLMDAIAASNEVIIDLETTGLDEHATGRGSWPCAARVSLAALTLPTAADPDAPDPPTFAVGLSHPESPLRGHWREVLTAIAKAIVKAGVPVSNQNLKFDDRWVYATTGVDLSPQFAWDTMVGSHLLDETMSTKLKERAPYVFDVNRWDDFDLSTPGASEKVPLFDLGLYACRDTYWTWRLAVLQRTIMAVGREGEHAPAPVGADEVEHYRLGKLAVWCAMPTSATLTAIEQRGILLDREWVQVERNRLLDSAKEHWDALVDLYPSMRDNERDPSFAPTSLWFADWTEAAVEAGDLRVAALTPTGKPQWGKSVLMRQARAGSEVAEHLLNYRRAVKRLEYLDSWLDCVTPEGLIHATYNAGRVVTGRLSASDPNMQQVTGSLKPAFIPHPGFYIVELDYSQIELRAAAHIAGCEPMLEAFRRGDDLHRLLAATITGKDPGDVTAPERQAGKSANFGFLYGMEAQGFLEYAETVYGVTFTPEEAVAVRMAFFDQWEGMADWHARSIKRAHATGQVVSPIGRVRRLPDLWHSNPSIASHAERQAINSPVQGFASDLMQIAAASIEGRLPGYAPVPEVRLIGTVHDSIIAEVPIDDWKRATGRMMRRMLDLDPVLAKMSCHLDVPLAVESKVGTRWGLGDIGVIR